jgi:hypothetical protein
MKGKMKNKEYRYQFLGFDEIESGKFKNVPKLGLGMPLMGSIPNFRQTDTMKVPIMKRIAMVFDKELGIVKQTEIK